MVKADISGIPDKIDFTFDVKPILADRCFICHGPDKNAIEAGLSLHKAEMPMPLWENSRTDLP